MNNFVKDNPAIIIILFAIAVASASVAATYFVLERNRIDNYETMIKQYKTKTEFLESQVIQLREENNKYLKWLEKSPQTILFFESEIKKLQKEKNETQLARSDNGKDNKRYVDIVQRYTFIETKFKGEAFIDPLTKAIIGVSDITINQTAKGTISLPGKSTENFSEAMPGKAWNYEFSGNTYQIVLTKIFWINGTYTVEVLEVAK